MILRNPCVTFVISGLRPVPTLGPRFCVMFEVRMLLLLLCFWTFCVRTLRGTGSFYAHPMGTRFASFLLLCRFCGHTPAGPRSFCAHPAGICVVFPGNACFLSCDLVQAVCGFCVVTPLHVTSDHLRVLSRCLTSHLPSLCSVWSTRHCGVSCGSWWFRVILLSPRTPYRPSSLCSVSSWVVLCLLRDVRVLFLCFSSRCLPLPAVDLRAPGNLACGSPYGRGT